MGVPKEEAEWYEGEVRSGRTLVTVRADGSYTEARDILLRHGAYDIESRHAGTMTGTTTSPTTGTARDFSTWDDASPYYRDRWQQRYGTMGSSYRWEDYEPSYRYAYDMYNQPEYRGRAWSDVEPGFRRDWESRYPDRPWNRFGDAVRNAWEDVTDRGRRRAA